MKKKIILVFFSISIGICITFLFLNKYNIYAKEKYLVYAFQVGAFEKYDNANVFLNTLPAGIIINDNNLYKVYVGIYKNIDIVNKMLVYYENNNIHIYLKNINVDKSISTVLDNYENILSNTEDNLVYNKVNQSILDLYLESVSE